MPKEKEKTRWDKFAEKKGIKGKKRDGKLEFNEELQEWKPKYGYKGKKGDGVQDDWLVEVDDKPKKEDKGGDVERRNKKLKARKLQQH